MERETGFEPATSTLARLHSTTELLPLKWRRRPDLNRRMEVLQASALPLGHFAEKGPLETVRKCNGADNGARTRDPNLGKVVLCQLSHVRLRVINLRELS